MPTLILGFKRLTNAIIGFAMYLENPRSQLFNHAIKTQSTVLLKLLLLIMCPNQILKLSMFR